jgi:hypothetical protein
MKIIQARFLILILFTMSFPNLVTPQENINQDLNFAIHRILQPLSISKKKLNESNTLSDLNKYYKASWIRTYINVEILTKHKGISKKSIAKNESLTQEQKDLLQSIDVGSEITVRVNYIPENNLKQNEAKEINFTFTVDPETEAQYIGGEQKMNNYFKTNAIDKIGVDVFKGYDLATVRFTVDEEGKVVDSYIFESSKKPEIDDLLLRTICNMPTWKPAQYANGKKVKQEFVLAVGNMENCSLNLLNIGKF